MRAFCPGIYARSEALVQATRDLDRGRTTEEAVDEQFRADLDELLRVQRDAGLDHLSDGMLRWQDLFRPLVEATDGLQSGPLTRFLDTNTFYRAPQATSEAPRLRAPLDERFIPVLDARRIVTLPSPHALGRHTGLPPRVLAEGVLKPQLEALPDEVVLVVLSEPFLARDENADLEALADALDALAGGPHLVLHLVFSDASALLRRGLAELPVGGIGIDFYRTDIADLPAELPGLLLAGVVDARSSVPEDPAQLAEFAARLREHAEHVALAPNGDLQFVPEHLAREKLVRLGRARTAAELEGVA